MLYIILAILFSQALAQAAKRLCSSRKSRASWPILSLSKGLVETFEAKNTQVRPNEPPKPLRALRGEIIRVNSWRLVRRSFNEGGFVAKKIHLCDLSELRGKKGNSRNNFFMQNEPNFVDFQLKNEHSKPKRTQTNPI